NSDRAGMERVLGAVLPRSGRRGRTWWLRHGHKISERESDGTPKSANWSARSLLWLRHHHRAIRALRVTIGSRLLLAHAAEGILYVMTIELVLLAASVILGIVHIIIVSHLQSWLGR